MPRINAGPALLQKVSSRAPSSGERSPCRTRLPTAFAPTGYPPISPRRNAAAPAPSMPNSRRNSGPAARPSTSAAPSVVKSCAATKKGNSAGMTEARQRDIPSRTPCAAVFPQVNSSSASTPVQAAAAGKSHFFKHITAVSLCALPHQICAGTGKFPVPGA